MWRARLPRHTQLNPLTIPSQRHESVVDGGAGGEAVVGVVGESCVASKQAKYGDQARRATPAHALYNGQKGERIHTFAERHFWRGGVGWVECNQRRQLGVNQRVEMAAA
jgi:hypothetical protein